MPTLRKMRRKALQDYAYEIEEHYGVEINRSGKSADIRNVIIEVVSKATEPRPEDVVICELLADEDDGAEVQPEKPHREVIGVVVEDKSKSGVTVCKTIPDTDFMVAIPGYAPSGKRKILNGETWFVFYQGRSKAAGEAALNYAKRYSNKASIITI